MHALTGCFYTVSQETSPTLLIVIWHKDYEILIIFGPNIPDTTGRRVGKNHDLKKIKKSDFFLFKSDFFI